MHKKIPEICTGCSFSEAKIYLCHSTEIAKARPHSEEWQTDTSVQKQWSMIWATMLLFRLSNFTYKWNLPTRKISKKSNILLCGKCLPCLLEEEILGIIYILHTLEEGFKKCQLLLILQNKILACLREVDGAGEGASNMSEEAMT